MSALRDADPYEMVNLVPELTGLPMTVHAMPRGKARHDVRLEVHQTHGPRMVASNTAVVGVRPVPHLVEGWLKPRDQQLVYQWAALNEPALVDYWNGTINSAEFLQRLRRLDEGAAA
jgi:hypothetical protein